MSKGASNGSGPAKGLTEREIARCDKKSKGNKGKTLEEYREAFDLFDKNKDGHITREELATCVHYFGMKYSEEELDQHITDFDLDGNKRVDFKEYLTVVSDQSRQQSHNEEEIQAAFAMFDINKDGFVSATELSKAMKDLGNKMTVTEVKDMLRAADFNEDGKIDYKEFTTMMFS